MLSFIKMTDGYKLDHRRQYPNDTRAVLSNLTPRTSRVQGQDTVVAFGLQYFLQRYFQEHAQETFFSRKKADVLKEYHSMLDKFLGPNHGIGVDHIADLHDLGYIPLRFYALPEGTRVPLRCPMFAYENTRPEFYWVTNYFETLLSSVIWPACTSATTATRYREILNHWATKSHGNQAMVPFQAHDFSFRGMMNPEAAALSGAGHLLSFTGSDCLPAIELLENYYSVAPGEFVGGGVPATEHSVMCAGGKDDELATYSRLLDVYPKGIVSVVSDTWDLWNVIQNILPKLKDKIMAREGTLVIRPDSGDPVEILCGMEGGYRSNDPTHHGVIELLWDTFGGTTDADGFRTLDSHIGAIYGDSITPERAEEICRRLHAKKFCSTNVVLGVGSYTYQHVTRDTYGFAVKSTWAAVGNEERMLMKDPITDNGTKKSATGRLAVVGVDNKLSVLDGLNHAQWLAMNGSNLLQPVWANGEFISRTSLGTIRDRLWPQKG